MVHLSLCAGSCCTARSRATSRNARHHRPRAAHKLVSRGRSNAIWLSKLYPFFLTRSHGLVPPSARTNCGIPFDLHIPIHRRVQDVTHHFIIDPIGPESPVDRKCELVSSNLSLLSLFNFLLVNTCHQPEPPFVLWFAFSLSLVLTAPFVPFLCPSYFSHLSCLYFLARMEQRTSRETSTLETVPDCSVFVGHGVQKVASRTEQTRSRDKERDERDGDEMKGMDANRQRGQESTREKDRRRETMIE